MILPNDFALVFARRAKILSAEHQRLFDLRRRIKVLERITRQEGLVSLLWQAWSFSCREVVLRSALSPDAKRTCNLREENILYLSREAVKNSPRWRVGILHGSHQEPTWGDPVKLRKIIEFLRPANEKHLLTAFGSLTRAPDLRIVRNSCAHLGESPFDELRKLSHYYATSHFSHPSDAVFWQDPDTKNFAWDIWVLECQICLDTIAFEER